MYPWSTSKAVAALRDVHSLPFSLTFSKAVMLPPSLVAKYLGLLLVLFNLRSLPLMWHLRVLRGVVWREIQYRLLCMSVAFRPRRIRALAEEKWVESFTPIGRNPLEYIVTYRSWASPDDSDFNLHLSNSSYAKTLDPARYKAAFAWFPIHFHSGGWMALASTQYHFIREIPIFSQYEVRMSIGSWDEKWVYLLCKFVTRAKGRRSHSSPPVKVAKHSSTAALKFRAPLQIPGTPLPTDTPPVGPSCNGMTEEDIRRLADGIIQAEEEEFTLHAISVSLGCFKIGRITVPPAVMLPYNGLSSPSLGSSEYSQANPPPHWKHVQSLLAESHGGSRKKMQDFMKGGWRNVPEGERWWEEALVGEIERKRLVNLEAFKAIRKDYDIAKSFGR